MTINIVLVLHHAGQLHPDLLPRELMEFPVRERVGYLTGPVGPEIEEDHLVPMVDKVLPDDSGTVRADQGWHHELVPLTAIVSSSERIHRIQSPLPPPPDQNIVSLLDPFPPLVPVHGVVSACDIRDPPAFAGPQLFLQLREV